MQLGDAQARGAQAGPGVEGPGAPAWDGEGPAVVLEVEDLVVSFGPLRAVDEVSLAVRMGELYAIVGESGCGKSTLAYALLDIVPPPGRVTSGEVRLSGRAITTMSRRELDGLRGSDIAIVFQGAMSALNPVLPVGRQVEHILEAHKGAYKDKAEGRRHFEELLSLVRLPGWVWDTYESRLSGGMKQRVTIAVALLLRPSVLILDEPTTALDVISQRLVIDVLRDVHEALGTTIIFVTHDLALVSELAERVAVMYAGRLVEAGSIDEIFYSKRRHPYTSALIDAIPKVVGDRSLIRPIPGQVPNLAELPPGCRFAPRCRLALGVCRELEPGLVWDEAGHGVACHVVNEGLLGAGGTVQ